MEAGRSIFDTDDDLLDEFGDEDDSELNNMLDQIEETGSQSQSSQELSQGQKDRMEKNKLKAVALKKSRLMANPYNKAATKSTVSKEKKLVDTGGGFFIEEGGEEDREARAPVITELPAPLMPPDQPSCEECDKDFGDSYLLRTFDHPVCDECKNMERDGPHELITKTDAKKQFLLTDTHIETNAEGKSLRFLF